MPKNDLSIQLSKVLNSILKFLTLLYTYYKPYLKYLILIILAYIAFRIGRSTKIDTLDRLVNNLSTILNRRVHITIHLPEKIKSINRVKKVLLGILILSAVIQMAVYAFKIRTFRKIKTKYVIVYSIIVLLLFLSAWIYEIILEYWLKKGRTQDLTINQKLYSLQKQLGPRAEGLLKIFLCKQRVIKQSSIPRGVCLKDNCKNYRQLLKQKAERIESLIQNALHFTWCAICKRKIPFQQFLQFKPEIYQQSQSGQQEQILHRNQYLFDEILRMITWAKQVSPCNCSRIYWKDSLKLIKQFKVREKQIDQKLMMYQSRVVINR